jgi:hypothetical protein
MLTLLNDAWNWLTLEHVLRSLFALAAAGFVFAIPYRLGQRFSRYLEDIEQGRRGWFR